MPPSPTHALYVMMLRHWVGLALVLFATAGRLAAQTAPATPAPARDSSKVVPFPTTTGREFALEVNRRFETLGNPDGNRLNAAFIQAWADRKFLEGDLLRMARAANRLLQDGHPLYPIVGQYLAHAAYLTRPDRHIRFTLTEYYNLMDKAREIAATEYLYVD